ncbi:MAG: MYXO-CTERM sorting domain-containing protein [Myxococcota bacterium]
MPLVPAAVALLAPAFAHAGSLDACGDIHLEAEAECELVAQGCDVECTPLVVEAACAGSLQVECSGGCELDAEVECTSSCQTDCEAQCRVDPGGFDCNAGCRTDCDASCFAACDSGDSECRAGCEANCAAECDASCDLVPPDADCVASCEGCCSGSCRAEVNLDCQLDCQAEGFLECSASVQGGCEADCSEAGGALFCDGDYIDHANNLDQCIDAIEGLLDGEVSGSANLECRGNECQFDSEGALSCSVSDAPSRAPIGLALGLLVGVGLLGRRRR